MGFTYKSSNVQAPDLYDPIDDNILLQGQKAIYDRTMAFAEEANKYKSAFFGQNAYGKDAEILKQKEAEYNAAISEVTKGGIESMEAQTAINAIINQASSDKDILGISQRTSAYERELKNKQEAEAKGETYVSPLLRQADKYYNSGKYYADERFNKTGFVAPTDKELDEIAKNTPEWENWVTTGGYDINQKGKAVSTLQANYLTHFQNNPKWSQLLDDKFEQETEGLDLSVVAQQGFAAIQQMFPYLPPQQQQQAYQDLQEGLQIQQQNPYAEGAWKQKLRDDYFSNQAYMAAQAKTYVNTTDKKQNAYTKDAIDFQQAKQLEVYKAIVLGALALGVSPEAIINGTAKDAQGNVITVDKAIQKAQDFKIQEAQAKQNIRTESQLKLENERQENRIEIINTKGEKITVKDNGAKQFKIKDKKGKEEYVDKKTLIEEIQRGDEKTIEKIINSNPAQFGNSSGVDPKGWFDGGVWFTEDNGIKYANYEADANAGGTKYRIPLTDIQKYVANPSHEVTVFSEDDDFKAPIKGSALEDIDKGEEGKKYYTPQGVEVDVTGYTQEDIQDALNKGLIK